MAIWQEFNNIDARDYAAQHPELFAYVKEAMTQPGKQYLLIGDTDHESRALFDFRSSPVLASLFKHAAVPHVAIEAAREMAPPDELSLYRLKASAAKKGIMSEEDLQRTEGNFWRKLELTWRRWVGNHPHDVDRPILDRLKDNVSQLNGMLRRGEISKKKAQDVMQRMDDCWIDDKRGFYGPQLLGYIHGGLRVTAADSWQWRTMQEGQPLMDVARRIFLGDREVAHYIDTQARSQKTAVIYGASHFYYKDAMSSRLGRDKCVHVDIFASRAHYRQTMEKDKMYTDYVPDRVYLIKERTLEKPDESLYKLAESREHDPRQLIKQVIAGTFGRNANPLMKETAVATMDAVPGIDPKWFNYEPA